MSTPPSYPGGMAKLYQFLGNTISYPTVAAENNIQGTIFLSFTIEKDGTLSDIKTEGRKLGYGLDDEALRVVKLSKRWNPGIQNGKPVRVKYNIPIRFTIPTETAKIKTIGTTLAATAITIRETKENINPLYIIDGKKQDHLAFNSLNPNTIENINVLKDVAATSLYGKEAENGAILITTKAHPLITTK